MELICIALILALVVVSSYAYWNGQDAKASCTEAWSLYIAMSDRRDALVEENRELQRRLETIEDALGERE
jgi:hypothetical protein